MQKRVLIILTIILLLAIKNINAQAIFEAVKAGDLTKVKELVIKNTQLLNSKNEDGFTPLHEALENNKNDISVFLINAGSDVNSKTRNNDTPLHIAANWRVKDICALLISKGAQVNVNNNANYTPLTNVIQNYQTMANASGKLETIKVLVEHGADVNAKGMWNMLPIQIAAEFAPVDVVEYLIDKGANIPVEQGRDAYQLLIASCSKGHTKLFEKLLEKGFDLQQNQYTRSLMHLAASGGSEKIMEILITKGFKVMTGDGYGWSPLHSAAEKGHLKVVEFLINKGADINDRSASGKTPYNLAEYFGHTEVCGYLASKGADTSEQQFPLLKGNYLGQKEPETGAKVFAPDIVTTKYMIHGNIVFSPKGDEAYWSPWCPAKGSSEEKSQIFTMKLENGKWGKPEIASFSKVGFDDDSPFVSPDGSKLFFQSRRPLKSGGSNTIKENIWYVTRAGNDWANPTPVEAVNSLQLHWQVSTDKKGNLYFGSGGEIFCSKYVNGKYTSPEKLSSKINSGYHEGSPYISPDGDYLLFDRSSIQGIQMGLFISFLKADGSWTEAKAIADAAKIDPASQCCNISYDGKYLFYIAGYTNEFGSFWVKSDFIKELKAKELL